MKRRRLGKSGITVSEICLGTMTFGLQSNEKESFAIMNKAFDAGINFMDSAEIYPVPPSFLLSPPATKENGSLSLLAVLNVNCLLCELSSFTTKA